MVFNVKAIECIKQIRKKGMNENIKCYLNSFVISCEKPECFFDLFSVPGGFEVCSVGILFLKNTMTMTMTIIKQSVLFHLVLTFSIYLYIIMTRGSY